MFIKKLTIDSLGLIKNRELQGFKPGVNAIVGDNGAGKSTTRHALGFSLFGLPAAKGKEDPRVNPSYFSEVNKTRRINVVIVDGENEVKITQESLDKNASENPIIQPESQQQLLADYLGDVSFEDFSNIWSMSEFDLRNIDPEQSDTIRKVLASRYGVMSEPITVYENILSRIENHTSVAKGKTGLSASVRDYTQTQKQQDELMISSRSAFDASSKLEELTREINAQQLKRIQLRNTSDEIAKSLAEFESITHSKEQAERELEMAQSELDTLNQHKPAEPSKEILAKESSINIHEGRLGDFFAKQQHLAELKQRKSELNTKLNTYPQTSYSFTEADCNLVVEEADRLRDIRRDTENNLFTQQTHVDEAERQLQDYRSSLPEPELQPAPRGSFVLIAVTLILCFGAAAFSLAQTQSALIAGIIGATGITLGIIEFVFSKSSNKHSDERTASPLLALESKLQTDKTQLTVLDREHDKALTDWETFIQKYFPAHTDLDFDEMYRHVKNLPEKIKCEQERDNFLQEITTKTQTIQAEEQGYSFLYKICFPNNNIEDPHDVSALIAQCKMRLNEELEARTTFLQYLAQEKELKSSAQSSLKRLNESLERMQIIANNFQIEISEVAAYLTHAQSDLAAQIRVLDDAILEMSREKGICEETLRSSVTQEEIDSVQSQLQEQRGDIKAKAREMCIIQIAIKLIDDALEFFQKTKAPEIVNESNAIFKRITEGAYIRILFPHEDNSDTLRVIDVHGNELTSDMLSVGTMRQLYLAIRLAVIKTQDHQSANLPVIFDEVLSSFDESKRAAAAREINEIAKDHQVFYFSVRNDFQDDAITNDWNHIDLNNGRIDTHK